VLVSGPLPASFLGSPLLPKERGWGRGPTKNLRYFSEPLVESKKTMDEYLDYTYDMFLSSITGERAEATRFDEWAQAISARLY
jgi:hypothetical protein